VTVSKTRLSFRPASLAAVAVLACACTGASVEPTDPALTLRPQAAAPPTGPPTVMRLVVRLEGDRLRVLSARPRRGHADDTALEAASDRLADGKAVFVEYRTLTIRGAVLDVGRFIVPVEARVEFLDPAVAHRVRRDTERLVSPTAKVNIPYSETLEAVDFARLVPVQGVAVSGWRRASLGRVSLSEMRKGASDVR
jgi:hypothetical protein